MESSCVSCSCVVTLTACECASYHYVRGYYTEVSAAAAIML